MAIPLSAQFCLCRLKFGRMGRAAGQDGWNIKVKVDPTQVLELMVHPAFWQTKRLLKGRHRSCSSRRAKLTERPAEARTLEGQDKVAGQTYTVTKDKVECYNSKNPKKPPHPYTWVDANVTCRDWKIRHGETFL